MRPDTYALLVDLVLLVHALFVGFVVGGFILILVGIILKWAWIRNFWFRCIHLAAIVTVAVKPIMGRYCPLTIWESRLRIAAGENAYSGGFIQHWVQTLIYYDLPLRFFSIVYVLFAVIVMITWIKSPPHRPKYLQSTTYKKSAANGDDNE